MLIRKEIEDYLKSETIRYYKYISLLSKTFENVPPRGMGSSLHEYIISLLFTLGKSNNLFPLPEYKPARDSQHRIDIVWFSFSESNCLVAAFEVDQTIYKKSIKKLSFLPEGCKKFIISMGLGKLDLNSKLLSGKNIELIDITQTSLDVYEHFKVYR